MTGLKSLGMRLSWRYTISFAMQSLLMTSRVNACNCFVKGV